MTFDTVPTSPATIREHDRQWRLGYQAGLRERRRLVVVSALVALVVLCRRHLHPLVALGLVVLLAPVAVIALAVEVTRHQHLRWRSTKRTLLMATSWVTAFGLAFLVVRFRLGSVPLVIIPTLAAVWVIDHLRRGRRERAALVRPAATRDAPSAEVVPLFDEPYRVLSTSRQRHTEVRRYPDGSVRTIDTRTGEDMGTDLPF